MNLVDNEEAARQYCLAVSDSAAIGRLERLGELLESENLAQNLVSAASLPILWQRHFADSLQLLPHVSRETGPWLDLGSGAGFPGLAIAAARPESEVILVESRKLRVDWLNRAVRDLGLANCRVIGVRVEDVKSMLAGQICARAFAPLDKLLRLSARFSTQDTVWLLPKGRSAAQELSEQPKSIQSMFHLEPSITDPAAGVLIGVGVPKPR